jgi:hypothetical protein
MSDARPGFHLAEHDDQCPRCGAVINAHLSSTADTRPPEAGDVGICGVCLGLLIFTGSGVRAPSGEEEAAIEANEEARAVLEVFRASMRAGRNVQ